MSTVNSNSAETKERVANKWLDCTGSERKACKIVDLANESKENQTGMRKEKHVKISAVGPLHVFVSEKLHPAKPNSSSQEHNRRDYESVESISTEGAGNSDHRNFSSVDSQISHHIYAELDNTFCPGQVPGHLSLHSSPFSSEPNRRTSKPLAAKPNDEFTVVSKEEMASYYSSVERITEYFETVGMDDIIGELEHLEWKCDNLKGSLIDESWFIQRCNHIPDQPASSPQEQLSQQQGPINDPALGLHETQNPSPVEIPPEAFANFYETDEPIDYTLYQPGSEIPDFRPIEGDVIFSRSRIPADEMNPGGFVCFYLGDAVFIPMTGEPPMANLTHDFLEGETIVRLGVMREQSTGAYTWSQTPNVELFVYRTNENEGEPGLWYLAGRQPSIQLAAPVVSYDPRYYHVGDALPYMADQNGDLVIRIAEGNLWNVWAWRIGMPVKANDILLRVGYSLVTDSILGVVELFWRNGSNQSWLFHGRDMQTFGGSVGVQDLLELIPNAGPCIPDN